MAMTSHNRNACAMRHQLWNTFCSRSYSVQRRTKDCTTPLGFGSENGGTRPKWVIAYQTETSTVQLPMANASLARGETSLRILNRSAIGRSASAGWIRIDLDVGAAIFFPALRSLIVGNRIVRSISRGSHAGRREGVFLHQVFLDCFSPLLRKSHVVRGGAGGIRVAVY